MWTNLSKFWENDTSNDGCIEKSPMANKINGLNSVMKTQNPELTFVEKQWNIFSAGQYQIIFNHYTDVPSEDLDVTFEVVSDLDHLNMM